MARILDGKALRDKIRTELKDSCAGFEHKPTMAIIQVGDRPDSTLYIKQKKTFAEKAGIGIEFINAHHAISQTELEAQIINLNNDEAIHGIIVQLPLPPHLNQSEIINTIDPIKDVDGLTLINSGLFWQHNTRAYIPATARGILRLFKEYAIETSGKHCVIIGKSQLVGKPIAVALMNQGATVTICHKKTIDLKNHVQQADIIIVAAGVPGLITKDFVKPGQIVVDVGINKNPILAGVVGDTVFSEIEPIVEAITPVPGGVGPLTVASLFENLVDAYKRQTDKNTI